MRFRKKPRTLIRSSCSDSKSLTRGLRTTASTAPLTNPTPMVGFIDVMGAARNETITVTGCARATSAPREASDPLIRTHRPSIVSVRSMPDRAKPTPTTAATMAGTSHGRIRPTVERGGGAPSSSVSGSSPPASISCSARTTPALWPAPSTATTGPPPVPAARAACAMRAAR